MMHSEDDKPTVRLDAGLIRGAPTRNPKVVGFKGVPYARPPLDGLRWRPPEPVDPWEGVRDAAEPGPACPQPTTPPAAFYTSDQPRTDEDCLYLNVWAPRGGRDLPVMVWIHGGAFIWGAASEPWYDGTRLAAEGAVVVTINYRLGLFGYLAHPELSAESSHGVSGNYGLLDQIAALRWVKRNVAAFGGDPERVTVFGQSAGALSVAQLMASPLAAGLFEGAIAQSVYMPAMPELRTERFGLPAAETVGAEFGRQLGVTDLAALRAMPAEALLVAPDNPYHMIGGTTAIVDGWVLPAQIFETFDRGEQAQVPLIAGYTSGEQRGLDPGTLPPFPSDSDAYRTRMSAAYGELAPAFFQLYPADMVVDSSYAAVRDAYYGWAVERLLRAHARLMGATWMFYFDHVYASAAARGLGAFHASDIAFTFGNIGPDASTPANWPASPQDPADVVTADAMMSYWLAFARSGRPDAPDRAAWPPFDLERRSCLMLGQESATVEEAFMPGMFELQDAYMARLQAADKHWSWANMGTAASPLANL